ncbi:type III-B CRISPR module RAMP protein Cmr1 [Desulfatirhabdium butyrativorans]|uniref:type III-B CRISPR module RAMP protein Cmr1 n=1 Tax=Desulfatirhabdium butyrativorans TaxID=340467 RepID=UPI0004218FFC|nr:type III-B CRISPR module RAMP protein Cmr1 [Desulfatirhabdium butyrativorans]
MTTNEKIYQFNALTDLWSWSVTLEEKNGQIKEKTVPDRLITTGLLGSIRWWFEVLVRGLTGNACDPTDTKCEDRNHCVVCELFGCTGWARKFRFEVLDEKNGTKTDQIKQNQTFYLRFTPLRPIRVEEWTLLDATLRLIAEYGAIGGKTVFKPTDEPTRASKLHHKDYGLVQMVSSQQSDGTDRGNLEKYLSKWPMLNHGAFAWASLQHFWCVNGKYLARQNGNSSSFNCVIGRLEPKQQSSQNDSWMAGRRPDPRNNVEAESKKVLSFKNPARTFGFVKPGLIDFNTMKERLTNAWGRNGWDFLAGATIINQLFAGKEGRS